MNTVKTGILMIILTGLLLVAGYFSFGIPGIIAFLIISLVLNFFTYWSSDKLALRMAHAKEVSPEDDTDLHRVVDEYALQAQVPKPRVYVIESDSPNAFATGRNPQHAAIAITTGIRRLLSRDELGGVIAHELAHVGNRDTLIMTMVATLATAIALIAMIARFSMFFGGFGGRGRGGGGGMAGIVGLLVVAIVLPLAATLVRLAISRAREYQADATGARNSGNPESLARALEKLEAGSKAQPLQVNEAVSHLFIVNPLSGGGMSRLFSTHPPIAERVRRLRSMSLGW